MATTVIRPAVTGSAAGRTAAVRLTGERFAVLARAAALVAVSAGLHWAAWRALEAPLAAAPVAVSARAPTVSSSPAVAPMLAWVARPPPVPALRAAVTRAEAGAASASPARVVASPSRRSGSAGSAGTPAPAPAPASEPPAAAAPEPVWLELWEVDEPPQFLVAPDDFDTLAAALGHPVRALVSLHIGSDGRLADIDMQADGGDGAPRGMLLDALRAAFAGLAFLPARRDGRPVPVVQRWRLAIDPSVPVMLGLRPLD
jgi:hypothetical protein